MQEYRRGGVSYFTIMWYCGTVPPRITTFVVILTKLIRGLSLVSASAIMYMYIFVQVHDIE